MDTRKGKYEKLIKTLDSLCAGETDEIVLMATVACELYHTFDEFDWVGFYRNVGDDTLKIGPYQGSHGCLTIPFSDGVCGKCARERKVQNVPDVTKVPYHIACSSDTRSEIVIPIVTGDRLIAVLDIDSSKPAAFGPIDEEYLSRLSGYFTVENRSR